MINSFQGKYDFLSNFYPVSIVFEGLTFKSTEAAFQAAKTLDLTERKQFVDCSASASKRLGRKVNLRADWERVKDEVMKKILQTKFGPEYPELQKKLLDTKNLILIEGNTWHDNYWGCCSCSKCVDKYSHGNKLGEILMNIRSEIQKELS